MKRKPKNVDQTPIGKLRKELKLFQLRAKSNNREGGMYGRVYAQKMVEEYTKAIQILEQQ